MDTDSQGQQQAGWPVSGSHAGTGDPQHGDERNMVGMEAKQTGDSAKEERVEASGHSPMACPISAFKTEELCREPRSKFKGEEQTNKRNA